MMARVYVAWTNACHIITFGHWPVWAVPGVWCQECSMRRLR